MTSWLRRLRLVGLALSLLTVAAAVSPTLGPDHLILALVLACGLTMVPTADTPLVPRLVSAHRRSQVCREVGVRSANPDRSGVSRARAPNQNS
ncbi:MAG: hypothetical protein Q4P07_11100 [Ornithinimicrobium sp.]|uniref:hypothetical protein n=1 Tax=Ornithinimicrobium sp. TaxID=1977084 RepID=UPI0026DEE94C|nr:hypothetical protein [Ornithinimicrobium sp.]MDO5740681.1 hypothetical protein [Ornithinimicrobium sp.]